MSDKTKNKENMEDNDNDIKLDNISFKDTRRLDNIITSYDYLIHHPYKISIQDRQYIGMLGYNTLHWMDREKEAHKTFIKQSIKNKKKKYNKCQSNNIKDFKLI